MTEELLETTIREMIEDKKKNGIGPDDQVTLLEVSRRFPDDYKLLLTKLTALRLKGVIIRGHTLNGTYIKFR